MSTATEQGVRTESEWVRCPKEGLRVPLSQCSACPKLVALRRSASGAVTQVVCPSPSDEARDRANANLVLRRAQVGELMTQNVLCAAPSLSVSVLVRMFLDSGLKALPVIDENSELVGLVSEEDVLLDLHAHAPVEHSADSVSELWALHDEQSFRGSTRRVRDVMTPRVLVVAEDVSVTHASALMAYEGVHRAMVVSKISGEVVGMLSAIDILCFVAQADGYAMSCSRAR